jgi:hypothetical protein
MWGVNPLTPAVSTPMPTTKLLFRLTTVVGYETHARSITLINKTIVSRFCSNFYEQEAYSVYTTILQ